MLLSDPLRFSGSAFAMRKRELALEQLYDMTVESLSRPQSPPVPVSLTLRFLMNQMKKKKNVSNVRERYLRDLPCQQFFVCGEEHQGEKDVLCKECTM